MGMTLIIETDPPVDYPHPFPKTDSKHFLSTIDGPPLGIIESGLGLIMLPLRHIATDVHVETIREDFGDEADEYIEELSRSCELAWHTPDEFIRCLSRLAEILEDYGRKLPDKVFRRVAANYGDRGYYQTGVFYEDVVGALAAMRVIKENGAKRARFFAF